MFYKFTQNNSYGVFTETDTLCYLVIIEADSESEAVQKAEELGCYWNGVEDGIDCPCCGDRWYKYPVKFESFSEVVSNIFDNKWAIQWTTPYARFFLKDNSQVEIDEIAKKLQI